MFKFKKRISEPQHLWSSQSWNTSELMLRAENAKSRLWHPFAVCLLHWIKKLLTADNDRAARRWPVTHSDAINLHSADRLKHREIRLCHITSAPPGLLSLSVHFRESIAVFSLTWVNIHQKGVIRLKKPQGLLQDVDELVKMWKTCREVFWVDVPVWLLQHMFCSSAGVCGWNQVWKCLSYCRSNAGLSTKFITLMQLNTCFTV